jgi:PUA domain protein
MDDYLDRIGTIVIDQGAIRFICNGANVMRPGIVRWAGEFQAGDIVAVKEAGHNKIIAVGVALVSSQDLSGISKGVAVKNVHYVGDPLWEAFKTIDQ